MSFFHTKKFYYYIALTTPIGVALQMMLGSLVQGTESGLSCPDWPLCYNQVLPLNVDPIVYIEFIHRVFATVVSLLIVILFYLTYYYRNEVSTQIMNNEIINNEFKIGVKRLKLMELVMVLLIVQIIFGGLTVLLLLDPIVVVIHLGVATALLAGTILLYVNVKPFQQK